MNKTNERFVQIFVFFLVFFIALSPVLFYKYFPTVDGPAHLYNARILRELLFGDSDLYSTYFHLNKVPVPNWTGHIIALVAGFFLPLWIIEKLIVLLVVCGLPLSIIYMARAYGAKSSWHMLLVMPFIYTITLYLGFFNFMLGLSLMFIFMARLKMGKFSSNFLGLISMTAFLCLIYFSHVMVFLLTMGFTILEILIISHKDKVPGLFSNNGLLKIIAFSPGILLSALFFSGRGVEGFKKSVDVLPFSQLWKWIVEGSPLVGLNGEKEIPATSIFMLGLILLIIGIIIHRIYRKSGWMPNDILLIFSGIMLLFYFVIPDGIASGGFVSLRLLLLFMLFITAWIVSSNLSLPVSILTGILGIYVSFYSLSYRHEVTRQLSDDVQNMVHVSESLKENTILLPLNYSTNWLHINLSNYIGANRNVIVLDNYEAVLNEFPLVWNESKAPGMLAGNFAQSLNPYISIENYEKNSGVKVDYVTRWQFSNDDNDSLKAATTANIEKIYSNLVKSGNCEVFGK